MVTQYNIFELVILQHRIHVIHKTQVLAQKEHKSYNCVLDRCVVVGQREGGIQEEVVAVGKRLSKDNTTRFIRFVVSNIL